LRLTHLHKATKRILAIASQLGNSTVIKSSKYRASSAFSHSQADKIGVLISNLGTPAAPTAKALRPYLKQFLSDPRVVEFPKLLWWLILNGIILNIRPKRSAHSYAQVWTDEGSPLAIHTKHQAEALNSLINDDNIVVEWAMRYGEPSIGGALKSLQDQGVRKLLVLPLYPQYSASTTASTFDAIAEDFTQRRWIPELRFITSYFEHPSYIKAVADSIRAHWEKHGRSDKLMFSYHGIPTRYLHNGDPYHCQCLKTSRLVADQLGLNESDYISSFQSRFGREEWLKPYTDKTLQALPGQGVKSIAVVCPGFSSDCLETIEEIGMENRDYFLEAGGESFHYIPALNADEGHIQCLKTIVDENMQGWNLNPDEDYQEREKRASACPHNPKQQ